MKHWYAVHCKPRQDERAEAHLLNQGFEIFRPRIRARRRFGDACRPVIESMFPRYLFVRLEESGQDWSPIRSTRGVGDLVRWGNCIPWIPNSVIERLQAQVDDSGCIALGDDGYRSHDSVRIISGPFEGLEGLFLARTGEERVVVLLKIMQQEQRVTLPERDVARA